MRHITAAFAIETQLFVHHFVAEAEDNRIAVNLMMVRISAGHNKHVARLSLPFIPSCLPTAVRLSGTDIILSQRILKLTTGAVITMLIPPDRASKPMQGHADAGSVHGGTEKN